MASSIIGLEGKVVVITGAGQGVGRSAARTFAQEGAKVVAVDVDGALAEEAAREIQAAGGEAMAVATDVTKADEVEALAAAVLKRFGAIDVGVNNVGNFGRSTPAMILDLDISFWENAISQNLRSTFLCSQAFARAMVQRGVRGAIVNVASMSGLRASVRLGPYGAAKAGVMHYTQTVAAELAPHGIRVNCVAPASINTPRAQASQSQERLQEMANAIPLKRLCEPEDVAKAILFMASDLSSFITGQTLMCDGGLSITSARPPMREDAAEARG